VNNFLFFILSYFKKNLFSLDDKNMAVDCMKETVHHHHHH
jgi:hypothetical protein